MRLCRASRGCSRGAGRKDRRALARGVVLLVLGLLRVLRLRLFWLLSLWLLMVLLRCSLLLLLLLLLLQELLLLLCLLLLLLTEQRCILMRARSSRDAVRNTRLASCACGSVHGILPLCHHGPREVLRRELPRLLRRQVRMLRSKRRFKLVELRRDAGRELRVHALPRGGGAGSRRHVQAVCLWRGVTVAVGCCGTVRSHHCLCAIHESLLADAVDAIPQRRRVVLTRRARGPDVALLLRMMLLALLGLLDLDRGALLLRDALGPQHQVCIRLLVRHRHSLLCL